MAEVNIFFKKLIAKRKDLSNLESQVLDYILKYPDKVAELNIDEFANLNLFRHRKSVLFFLHLLHLNEENKKCNSYYLW